MYLSEAIMPRLPQVKVVVVVIVQGEVSIHPPGVEAAGTGVELRAGTLVYVSAAGVGVTGEANLEHGDKLFSCPHSDN